MSYAWGEWDHENWVQNRLSRDLKEEGLEVILDQTHNWKVGKKVPAFIDVIPTVDFVIVVGTKLYKKKYENQDPLRAEPGL